MINEKKLICAFIYSAYESGYCGLMLDLQTREKHKKIYREYVEAEKYFPKREIEETQREMMDSIQNTGIRNYIYEGHFKIVKERIEEDTNQPIARAVKSPLILNPTINCPINYYKVKTIHGDEIIGENLIYKIEKRLRILNGLERPNVGEIVSGHWNFMLEVVSDWQDLTKYLDLAREYYSILKKQK